MGHRDSHGAVGKAAAFDQPSIDQHVRRDPVTGSAHVFATAHGAKPLVLLRLAAQVADSWLHDCVAALLDRIEN
jgi:hypothetical protein